MKSIHLALFFHFLYWVPCTGQSVENPAYNLLLQTLLSHSIAEVSVNEIANDSMIVFVDAREKQEYEVSHIQNAVWVGYDGFDIGRLKATGKAAKIAVYCSVGYRSEKIAEKLKQAGYSNVTNLYGGIFEWKNQNRPVFNSTGETNQIHAYSKAWGVWLNEGEKVYD